jgi:hypothetical protein
VKFPVFVDPLFVPLIQIFSGGVAPCTGIVFLKLKTIPPLLDIEGRFVVKENDDLFELMEFV